MSLCVSGKSTERMRLVFVLMFVVLYVFLSILKGFVCVVLYAIRSPKFPRFSSSWHPWGASTVCECCVFVLCSARL